MSTYTLGLPSELRHRLDNLLPRQDGTRQPPAVQVIPRDRSERKCAAYDADHYEVQAFYTTYDVGSLNVLERALRDLPGVYAVTQVLPAGAVENKVTNPEWPVAASYARRGFHDLRPQVLALIRD